MQETARKESFYDMKLTPYKNIGLANKTGIQEGS